MEKVKFKLEVLGDYLEIIPEEPLKDNSIYEIKLKNFKSLDGTKELPVRTIKFVSKMTPSYCTVNDVLSIIHDFYINEEDIMLNIRTASRYANYLLKITGEADFLDENEKFEVEQFVRFQAAYECALKYYMEKALGAGGRGKLGEVEYQYSDKVPGLSNLLRILRDERSKWNLALQGHKEFRANMKTGVRGSKNKRNNEVPKLYNERTFIRM